MGENACLREKEGLKMTICVGSHHASVKASKEKRKVSRDCRRMYKYTWTLSVLFCLTDECIIFDKEKKTHVMHLRCDRRVKI